MTNWTDQDRIDAYVAKRDANPLPWEEKATLLDFAKPRRVSIDKPPPIGRGVADARERERAIQATLPGYFWSL